MMHNSKFQNLFNNKLSIDYCCSNLKYETKVNKTSVY